MDSNGKNQKIFNHILLSVALPVGLQNLLSSSVNLLDNLMIGQLGDSAIAGLGIASQIFFLFLFLIFGINNGGAILVAQLWGRKDLSGLQSVVGICMTLGVGMGLIFTAITVLFPYWAVGLFTPDPEVIIQGASYLRVVGLSYGATAVSFALAIQLRSVEKATPPMVISFISICLNTVGNYVLIFGLFGFPALGVLGAAISTCLARYLECGLLIVVVYCKKYPVFSTFGRLFSYNLDLLRIYLRRAVPVIAQEFSWAFGITLYQVVYARISTETLAAVNIVSTVERFVFVVFVGMGSAAGVVIGKSIGEEKEEAAQWLGRKFFRLACCTAILLGAIITLLRTWFLGFYQVSPEVQQIASEIFLVLSCILWIKAGNMLFISGIFRSGGDTRFAFMLDTFGIWVVGLPLGLLMAFVFHVNPVWVYLAIAVEEFVKLGFALRRFASKKWIHNVLNDDNESKLLVTEIA